MIGLAGCSDFRNVQKNGTLAEKLEAAIRYYEEEQDYYKAALLFEEVIPVIRGSNESEQAEFYYAYTQYHLGNYLLSAEYFNNFYEVYNRSEYAEEAFFMYAYSEYMSSPEWELDQTSTRQAIIAMQNFINRFPGSKHREEASMVIDEMQGKLEKKAYMSARQYYEIYEFYGSIKAAIVAFDNFRKDYPDSDYDEEAFYLMLEAQYTYAAQSIPAKQTERYREFIDMYEEFINFYPQSDYIKKLGRMYQDTIDELENLNS